MRGLIKQIFAKSYVSDFSKLIVGAIVFFLFLTYPPQPLFNNMMSDPRRWLPLLALMLFFILLLSKDTTGWETVQTACIFALFAIPLVCKWQVAHYDGEIIGGLLPWSDASQYSWEAQRLANGLLLSEWGARRPLFSGFLAVLFRLTGDFKITLSILTLLNAIAVFFTIRVIKRFYGHIAAGFFLIASFEFYVRFAGKTLTEQLGFAWGNFALFFLLIGAHTKDVRKILFGLGLLAMALNARAGAFLILPALVLWTAFFIREHTTAWRAAGMAIAVVSAIFLFNLILVKVIADPKGTPFSNYSYTLYGLASGNKGWTQVILDYPNVSEGQVMSLAIQKIRSEPSLLLKGMLSSFADYFGTLRGAYIFFYQGPMRDLVNFLLWGLVAIGLVSSMLNWRNELSSLMIASFLGVIFSLPLLPPIDADGMRVFAATIPFSILWVTSGIAPLVNLITRKEGSDTGKETELYFQKYALFFSVLLFCMAFPVPVLLRTFPSAPVRPGSLLQPSCNEPGQELIKGSKLRDTSIFIIPNDTAPESYVPFIRIRDFRKALTTTSAYPFLESELLDLKPGDQISIGLQEGTGILYRPVWMISKFPISPGVFSVCGRSVENEQLRMYYFYTLDGESVSLSSLTVSQQMPAITKFFRLLYTAELGIVSFLLVIDLLPFKGHFLTGRMSPKEAN